MPWLHAKGRRTGSVDRGSIAQRRKQISQVCIVRITHVPLGSRLAQRFKIHMPQNLTHQLSAAAGDQDIILLSLIIFHQFSCALLRCVADAHSFHGITVRTKIQLIAQLLKFLLRILKTSSVWLDGTAKRRRHKTDGASHW